MFRPRHGGGYETLGEKEIEEKYGIASPLQVIDLLALMGDSADNFPGCPGVGEKTAAKLINEFGSVENLIENSSKVKGKLRERLKVLSRISKSQSSWQLSGLMFLWKLKWMI